MSLIRKSPKPKPARSEEIQDIIDRMPTAFGRNVAVAVTIFAFLLLLFGWIIKYPDSVSGQIKISSDNVPIKLVAGSSGMITILGLSPRDVVHENQYIAVLQNTTDIEDVKLVTKLMEQFDPALAAVASSNVPFPEKVSLGELNLKYYTFLNALKLLSDHEKDNVYEKQRKGIVESIFWKEEMSQKNEDMEKTIKDKKDISIKWHHRYVSLHEASDSLGFSSLSEFEADVSKNDYLSALQNEQNLEKEMISIRLQITNDQNSLDRLDVEQKEKESQMRMNLLSSYYDLKDNIKMWEQRYVFKAPFAGRVEFLKFLSSNQFIQQGEEVFGIVPEESKIAGQMMLPAGGAGKVNTGNRVSIQLENYPYLEYGTVEGAVSSISLITNQQRAQETMVNTYLIHVDLPSGLKTNYGEKLDFKFEIEGVAHIIVKERRLIERLFDNLKYRMK